MILGSLQLKRLERGIIRYFKKYQVFNLGPPIEAGESVERESIGKSAAGISVLSLSGESR